MRDDEVSISLIPLPLSDLRDKQEEQRQKDRLIAIYTELAAKNLPLKEPLDVC